MADLAAIFITSFIVGFSGAMMPGPVSAVTLSEGARRGFRAGPLITVGHAVAEVAIVVALAMGLSGLLQHSFIAAAIGLLGGALPLLARPTRGAVGSWLGAMWGCRQQATSLAGNTRWTARLALMGAP